MSYAAMLRDVDILADLSDAQLEAVSNIAQERSYAGTEIIFKENTPSRELYIILNGMVEILVDPSTLGTVEQGSVGVKTIATLRRGECFGEVSLVDQGLRTASVMAATDNTRVLVIDEGDFAELCRQDYELGFIVMRNIASNLSLKLRQTNLMMHQEILKGA